MTKQEKIIEAWKGIKPIQLIDENGWSINEQPYGSFDSKEYDQIQYYEGAKIRPKSLQGIENNNGWIKIESEADLPKEDGLYYLIRNNGVITWNSVYISNMDWLIEDVTHYQPIVKPKPPVY